MRTHDRKLPAVPRPFTFLVILLLGLTLTTVTVDADICGDVNGDGAGPDLGDLTALVGYLFISSDRPISETSADLDGDAEVDLADLELLLDYLYLQPSFEICLTDPGDAPYPPITEAELGGNDSTRIEPDDPSGNFGTGPTYPIVDSDQNTCYDASEAIVEPLPGSPYYGQDAQHDGHQMSYTFSDDQLTVHDNVTGLTWTQSPDLDDDGDIDVNDKLTYAEALAYPATLNASSFGGFDDWRLPSMKELYSLMNFNGTDPSGPDPSGAIPFIDTSYFEFGYGDESAGERLIDAQFWTTSAYVGTVFDGQSAAFGLNIADGRIKGYPTGGPVTKLNYVYFVRGNEAYGVNDFEDNSDGTVSDLATGLMWTQDEFGDGSGTGPRSGMTWIEALAWVQEKNVESFLGYDDWRLPNAKEMQSLVDYSRAPDVTSSAAIDPIFSSTQITNEDGETDYPWCWTSTTHVSSNGSAHSAAYICFGKGMGYMFGSWMDVHGAGCQRSDRKDGNFSQYTYVFDGYYFGIAPQGDAARLYNYVRLVRDIDG